MEPWKIMVFSEGCYHYWVLSRIINARTYLKYGITLASWANRVRAAIYWTERYANRDVGD